MGGGTTTTVLPGRFVGAATAVTVAMIGISGSARMVSKDGIKGWAKRMGKKVTLMNPPTVVPGAI